jgi:hypothetical protein
MDTLNFDASRVVDPTGAGAGAASGLRLAKRSGSLRGLRVGLLDNAKQNARELLDSLAVLLKERYGVGEIIMYRKQNNTAPVASELLSEMEEHCDVVITAVGDCGSCSVLAIGDGIALERDGVPAAVLCTEAFKASSDAVAAVYGAPGYEYVLTAHPIAGLAPEQIANRAEAAVDGVARLLVESAVAAERGAA